VPTRSCGLQRSKRVHSQSLASACGGVHDDVQGDFLADVLHCSETTLEALAVGHPDIHVDPKKRNRPLAVSAPPQLIPASIAAPVTPVVIPCEQAPAASDFGTPGHAPPPAVLPASAQGTTVPAVTPVVPAIDATVLWQQYAAAMSLFAANSTLATSGLPSPAKPPVGAVISEVASAVSMDAAQSVSAGKHKHGGRSDPHAALKKEQQREFSAFLCGTVFRDCVTKHRVNEFRRALHKHFR
jgi:hypothetical protein